MGIKSLSINFSNVWRYITSRKFAIYLLFAILFIFLVGSVVPNVALMQPGEAQRFKSTNPIIFWLFSLINPIAISRSYYFYIVCFLLLNSLIVCTFRRLKWHFKKRGTSKTVSSKNIPLSKHNFSIDTQESLKSAKQKIILFLKNKRWQVRAKGVNFITVQKGGFGFWGSILFHLSLILISIGAILTGTTRFEALLLLTEGFTVPVRDAIIVENRPIIGRLPMDQIIFLKKITTRHNKSEILVDIAADITVGNLSSYKQKSVRVNKALVFDKYTFTLKNYGIAPKFVFIDHKNNNEESFNVNLGDWQPGSWTEKGRTDSFKLLDPGYTVKVQFVPNLKTGKDDKVISAGKLVKNPALILRITDKNDKQIAKGLVKEGASIKFQTYELRFKELNYWGSFFMTRDSGLYVIVFSVITAIIGIAIRFIFFEKNIKFLLENKEDGLRIAISGKASYFPIMFENEMKILRDDLVTVLKGKS